MSSTEYEENLFESQESFVVENTDTDIDELIDLISNLHLYCYEPEKDASESSTSDSDTNEEYWRGKCFSQICWHKQDWT